MKTTILGCSGSLAAPGNPASGYLVTLDGQPPFLVDCGPGVLAALQQVTNPGDVDVVFSHLHADHCLDFPSLLVWRRYHPSKAATGKNQLCAPQNVEQRLAPISSDDENNPDPLSDTFDLSLYEPRTPLSLGSVTITPYPAIHPIESYSLRFTDTRTGKVFAYSGDTAAGPDLVACAEGADLFFCEASWGPTEADKAPDMHMSAVEAAAVARQAGVKHLVLVHIPPWEDKQACVEAAREVFDGPVSLGEPFADYDWS